MYKMVMTKIQLLFLLMYVSFSVQSITFETTLLTDTSESNYVKFIGEQPLISDLFRKKMADFNGDGFDDILSLGGNLPCTGCAELPPTVIFQNMELLLYQDGKYVLHEINIPFSGDVNIIDFDLDGDLDIVLSNGNIAINNGVADFSFVQYFDGYIFKDFYSVDIDQDGDVDIISSDKYFINDGNLNFSEQDNTTVSGNKFTVADLNGDGISDLLVFNENQLQTWLNNGVGQFELLSAITTENDTVPTVKAIDINNDNVQDFVLSYQENDNPIIKSIINDGQGNLTISSFEFSQINAVVHNSMHINGVFAEDKDNDGDLDLWISATFIKSECSYNQSLLLLYENLDDGNLRYQHSFHSSGYDFETSLYFAFPAPSIMDLNHDNLPDVSMPGDRPVVWLQKSNQFHNGEFSLSNVSSLQFNNQIDVVDMNVDGNIDILTSVMNEPNCSTIPYSEVISSTSTYNVASKLWLGDGEGRFQPFYSNLGGAMDFLGPHEYSRVADLEQIGNPSVIYTIPASNGNQRSTLYVHPLAFDPPFIIHFPEPTITVEVANLDSEEKLEIVMIADSDEASIVVLGYQYPHFREIARLEFGFRKGEIQLADMDNDGNIDIVANSKADINAITIWYNDGDENFIRAKPFGDGVKAMAVADFDGDGRTDIFASNSNHEMWINQGNRNFDIVEYDTSFWNEPFPIESQNLINLIPTKLESKDINSDGLADLFAYVNNKLHVYINNSNNNISFYKNYSNELTGNQSDNPLGHSNIAFADFNNDGVIDFASGGDYIKINTQKEVSIVSGLYYDKQRNGHGFSIENLGFDNLYYSIFYSYDEMGKPDWFSMLNRHQGYEGGWSLNRVNGNNMIHYIYDYNSQSTMIDFSPENMGWLRFDNDNNLDSISQASYRIYNDQSTWDVDEVIPRSIGPSNDLSGIWWGGSEDAGWGISFSFVQLENSQAIVAIIYFYDETGMPRWLIGQADGFELSQNLTIEMKQLNGYGRLQNYVELSEVSAGSITINLNQASNDFTQAGNLSMDVFYPDDQFSQNYWVRDNIPIALFSKPRD